MDTFYKIIIIGLLCNFPYCYAYFNGYNGNGVYGRITPYDYPMVYHQLDIWRPQIIDITYFREDLLDRTESLVNRCASSSLFPSELVVQIIMTSRNFTCFALTLRRSKASKQKIKNTSHWGVKAKKKKPFKTSFFFGLPNLFTTLSQSESQVQCIPYIYCA